MTLSTDGFKNNADELEKWKTDLKVNVLKVTAEISFSTHLDFTLSSLIRFLA